ncbi:hypothetical protein [Escherichia phage C6]|nr:hypothetical protein [Escherichia phage C6]
MSELEIRSNFPWPSCALSNFAKWPFVMDGIQFGGLEGFLQGCKVKNVEQQRRIFGMSGLDAQKAGRAYARAQDRGTLFWLGTPFSRYSEAWKELYESAYFEAALQNKGFRDALQSTKGKVLKHSMASHLTECDTILTEKEFIDILNKLRDLL